MIYLGGNEMDAEGTGSIRRLVGADEIKSDLKTRFRNSLNKRLKTNKKLMLPFNRYNRGKNDENRFRVLYETLRNKKVREAQELLETYSMIVESLTPYVRAAPGCQLPRDTGVCNLNSDMVITIPMVAVKATFVTWDTEKHPPDASLDTIFSDPEAPQPYSGFRNFQKRSWMAVATGQTVSRHRRPALLPQTPSRAFLQE